MTNINKMNQSKQTSYCHSRPDRESMFGSAWKVENYLNGSCQRVNGFRTKSGMTGECGRSMVEMLGVLAIIGVLSVGGIAGYTMAMNKHRANEILNAASIRAMVVSTQIQNGTSPTLVEFGSEKVGNVSITLNPYTTGDATFTFSLATVDESVCSQMKNIISTDSQNPKISDDANCATLTYNKDLGEGTGNSGCTPRGECESCLNDGIIDDDSKCGANEICIDGNCTSIATGSGCLTNADCKELDETNCGNGECFCNFDMNVSDFGPVSANGRCEPIADFIENSDLAGFVCGGYTDWFSAKNFCAAQNKRMVSFSDIGCPYSLNDYKEITNDIDDNMSFGLCCATKDDPIDPYGSCTTGTAAPLLDAIYYKARYYEYIWLKESANDSSHALYMYGNYIDSYARSGDSRDQLHALCK